MFEEFKKFAMRGNVVDLAVGVIIGAAFGKIVDFVREFVPNAEEKLEHYPGERPLFELYNIEDDSKILEFFKT